jgi:glycosyltransferase involved in cell wall biosynthesis
MPRISATVITLNEEDQIGGCLESLAWADQRVVVDSGSTDRTVEIARSMGATVVHHAWPGFSEQKNYAADLTDGDWVLQFDADERVTPELRREIQSAVARPGDTVAFFIPRLTYWAGQPIRHGGWYPDYCLRLFRRGRARWEGKTHERLVVEGPTARLRNPMHHFSYRDVREHVERMLLRSADLEVRESIDNGLVFCWLPPLGAVGQALRVWREGPGGALGARMVYKQVVRNRIEFVWMFPFLPVLRFLERFVLRLGFLDGARGFWIAVLSALYEGVRAARLWEHYELNVKPRSLDRVALRPAQRSGDIG